MDIIITRATAKSFERYDIDFQSTFGAMIAMWSGEEPDVEKQYAVEIEIEDTLVWGSDITLREDRGYCIFERGEQKYFWGWIERIDEDGLLMLKIGTSLLMVSTAGEPLAQSGFVEIVARNVSVYDENI